MQRRSFPVMAHQTYSLVPECQLQVYTTQEIKMTKDQKRLHLLKLKTDVLLAKNFTHHVVAKLLYADKIGCPPLLICQREIRDNYGRDGLRVFKLMFRQLQRGGITRDGVAFKTSWVFNYKAQHCTAFLQWVDDKNGTLKMLHAALLEENIIEEVWERKLKTWMSRQIRDASLKYQRQQRKKSRKYIESVEPRDAEERERIDSLRK